MKEYIEAWKRGFPIAIRLMIKLFILEIIITAIILGVITIIKGGI